MFIGVCRGCFGRSGATLGRATRLVENGAYSVGTSVNRHEALEFLELVEHDDDPEHSMVDCLPRRASR